MEVRSVLNRTVECGLRETMHATLPAVQQESPHPVNFFPYTRDTLTAKRKQGEVTSQFTLPTDDFCHVTRDRDDSTIQVGL